MYKDSLGVGMCVAVYIIMALGNGIFLWVVVRPNLLPLLFPSMLSFDAQEPDEVKPAPQDD